MEGSITTACTIAFIKQQAKAALTVTYFLRKRKFSNKAELMWFRHPSRKGNSVTLKSANVCVCFGDFGLFVFFGGRLTDKSGWMTRLFLFCTTIWSGSASLQRTDVWRDLEKHASSIALLIYTQIKAIATYVVISTLALLYNHPLFCTVCGAVLAQRPYCVNAVNIRLID